MESEIKELLRRNLEMTERTLQLVQKVHRGVLWSRFFGFLKWVIIVGGAVWGYLQVQPYLEEFLRIKDQVIGF